MLGDLCRPAIYFVKTSLCHCLFSFCSVLFSLWSLCGGVFMHGNRPVAFFMVIPIENVSKCLWPCSLYGKDIIHHVKQEKIFIVF